MTVERVGRRWVYLDNAARIDAETMWADGAGFGSPGRCYLSEAEFHDEMKLCATWDSLRQKIATQYRPPDGVTLSQVENALRSLFKRSADNGIAGTGENER